MTTLTDEGTLESYPRRNEQTAHKLVFDPPLKCADLTAVQGMKTSEDAFIDVVGRNHIIILEKCVSAYERLKQKIVDLLDSRGTYTMFKK